MFDGDSLTVMSDSVNTSSKTKLCPLCKATGKTNKLRLYQVNLTEAVLLCTGEKCTYPMGIEPSQNIIFLRDAASATFSKKLKVQASPFCFEKQLKSGKGQTPHCVASKLSENLKSSPSVKGSYSTTDKSISGGLMLSKHLTDVKKYRYLAKTNRKNDRFKSYVAEVKNLHEGSSDTTTGISDHIKMSDHELSVKNGCMYPQWYHQGLYCWLTALLNLLVHSRQLQRRTQLNHTKSDLLRLINKYNLVQKLCKQAISKSSQQKQSMFDRAEQILEEETSHLIQDKAAYIDKKKVQTVSGLKSLLDCEPSHLRKTWMIKGSVSTFCHQCYRQNNNSIEMPILMLSKLQKDFTMSDIEEAQQLCDNCSSHSASIRTTINHYPLVLFVHCMHGIQGSSVTGYDFNTANGALYRLKGIIQHGKETGRYVTWIRDMKKGTDELWNIMKQHG